MKKEINAVSVILGFVILFVLYHGAEYMILFRNSPMGFLAFHFLFILAAWGIARYQFGEDLKTWGFLFTRKVFIQMAAGIFLGTLIYLLSFYLSLQLGIEQMVSVPSFKEYGQMLGLFIFGNFFSSFSEDVLTRGYVYKHLKGRVSTVVILLVSPMIYVLNHIYRLADGPETYLYLFLLGVLFLIPLIKTQQIWTTGAIHWGYNCTFYFTHELIRIKTASSGFGVNYLLSIVLIVCIAILAMIPQRSYRALINPKTAQ